MLPQYMDNFPPNQLPNDHLCYMFFPIESPSGNRVLKPRKQPTGRIPETVRVLAPASLSIEFLIVPTTSGTRRDAYEKDFPCKKACFMLVIIDAGLIHKDEALRKNLIVSAAVMKREAVFVEELHEGGNLRKVM